MNASKESMQTLAFVKHLLVFAVLIMNFIGISWSRVFCSNVNVIVVDICILCFTSIAIIVLPSLLSIASTSPNDPLWLSGAVCSLRFFTVKEGHRSGCITVSNVCMAITGTTEDPAVILEMALHVFETSNKVIVRGFVRGCCVCLSASALRFLL